MPLLIIIHTGTTEAARSQELVLFLRVAHNADGRGLNETTIIPARQLFGTRQFIFPLTSGSNQNFADTEVIGDKFAME